MYCLLRKEIQGFFSSLTGYLVIIVFLAITGLCLWVFPGAPNIPENGHASLDSLFYIAPWVFLFLAPALTMRSFAEEFKSGAIEWLLTRPVSEWQIVTAKFLAAVILIALAVLPCSVFALSVWWLGNPPGNMDTGATCGALTGLLLLGGIYAAIGIFSSALTSHQVVAFISAALLCFIFYEGFDALAQLITAAAAQDFVLWLSIKEHYASISRGVIDFRDLVYFFGVMALFLSFTRLKLKSRKWK
ncbi:MAG: gliding motility-associated ABC transporter permease subunit GldF [Bacteroidales bacterium]|jgi:ABC-2 type transport system permease protein|nr:gliding motility-associated ABC transporter permease subunit GldF [Bacteroidales bacterium]